MPFRFNLAQKLWLTLFLSLSAMTAVLALWFMASVNQGFGGYLERQQQARVQVLKPQLEAGYRSSGSWSYLRDNPELWTQLQRDAWATIAEQTFQPVEFNPSRRLFNTVPTMAPTTEKVRGAGKPLHHSKVDLMLATPEREIILGAVQALRGKNRWLELEQDNRIIGYLGYNMPRHVETSSAAQFLQQQSNNLLVIALSALLISGLIAFPLARWLVRPLKRLQAATRELSGGNYRVRTQPAGRDEIASLARDFNELASTLEANEKSRRRWAADISHELRTPLTFIKGQVEALQDGVRQPTPANLQAISVQANQLGKLVDDLYQLSLSELGGLNYRKEWLPAGKLLRAAIAQSQDAIVSKGLSLQTGIDIAEDFQLYCDQARMLQLFNNLLSNSMKYTDAPGVIRVRARVAAQQLQVTVEDSAPAVSAEDLPRLSDHLYRGDASRNSAIPGAGIGLALCRNIAAAHNGRLQLDLSPMGGLKVTLSIPG